MATGKPTIRRTRTAREVVRALANLNDQFSFFLFLEHQFDEQLRDLGHLTLSQYTSQAFHRNPFSARIHVRVGSLRPFLQANRGVSFGAYLSTSYEVAAGFTDRACQLLRSANGPAFILPIKRGRETPEHYYRRVLTANGYSLPAKALSDTMALVRHRRNAIVHLSAMPNLKYQAVARTNGPSVNAYWKNSKIQIDFTRPTVGPPSEPDSLDLIKLLRVVTQKLDTHIASIIDVSGLISAVAHELFGEERVRMNKLVRDMRVPKLRAKLISEFGFSGSTSMIAAAAGTVGVK